MQERLIAGTQVRLVRGDITRQEGLDVIVNAANEELAAGGGVCGAIHAAAGPELAAECAAIRAAQGRVSAGGAVMTGAGKLPMQRVIHAVGPRWRDGIRGENIQLESAWTTSLELTVKAGLKMIGFPSISTGIFGFPIDRAALIALATVGQWLKANPEKLSEVRVVLFNEADLAVYADALAQVAITQLGE